MKRVPALDRIIEWLAPGWGVERMLARRALEAGRKDRTTATFNVSPQSGNPNDLGRVQQARSRAWNEYWDNPDVRKATRAMCAQVVGCGMKPKSLAQGLDGSPLPQFRRKAKRVWDRWSRKNKFGRLQCQALIETSLSGEVLVHDMIVRDARGVVTLRRQLLESERLVDDTLFSAKSMRAEDGNYIFRGIEFNSAGERVAYHVYRIHPNDPRAALVGVIETDRIEADKIVHLFLADRPGQVRGITWWSPALLQVRDVRDYQENEMMAAAVSACATLVITRRSGAGVPTLNFPTGASTVDGDGNTISRIQPGLILNAREGDAVTGFNPMRPNSNAEGFINHLLRSIAGAMPGVKASTIIGDYRQSSFSSEKAADNDCWREVEQIQEWFADAFCQSAYEKVIRLAILAGEFDDTEFGQPGVTLGENESLLEASWAGPVSKSIQQEKDEFASRVAVQNGTSNLQFEAASRGMDWMENLESMREVVDYAESLGLPEPYVMSLLGLDGTSVPDNETSEAPDSDEDEESDPSRSGFIRDNHRPAWSIRRPPQRNGCHQHDDSSE